MFGTITRTIVGACVLLALTVTTADAQRRLSEEELREQPGYVDFEGVWNWSDGDEEVELILTQPLLGFAGAFVRGEDPDLADLILDLHLVRVNQFTFSRGDEDQILEFIDDTDERLRGDQWDNIVKVRDRDERVNVFVKLDGDGTDPAETYMNGLCILVIDGDEAAFVNVVGRFRLEDIARVGAQFDIPYAEDFERYNRRGDRRDASRDEEGQ